MITLLAHVTRLAPRAPVAHLLHQNRRSLAGLMVIRRQVLWTVPVALEHLINVKHCFLAKAKRTNNEK